MAQSSKVFARDLGVRLVTGLCTFFALSGAFAADGDHLWSKNFGGRQATDLAIANAVATDSQDNIVTVGQFSGQISFDGEAPVGPSRGWDIFILKHAASGALLWKKHFGSTGVDNALAVAIDHEDNVIVTGSFVSSIDLGIEILTSAGAEDLFVLKLNSAGETLWAKRFGGSGTDIPYSLALSRDGSPVIGGMFWLSANLGGEILQGHGGFDIFLAKYSPQGVHVWSKAIGGADLDRVAAIAVDGADNVSLTGRFKQSVDFGHGAITAAGDFDIFLASYAADGSPRWTKSFGNSNLDVGVGLATDLNGDLILLANFRGTVDFGGGPKLAQGQTDIFLGKYSSAGNLIWEKEFSGSNLFAELPKAVAVDALGNILTTGAVYGPVDFGGGFVLGANTYDVFVAKFNTSGAHLWSKRAGEALEDYGYGIAADKNGNAVVVGNINVAANFGDILLESPGGLDAFIAKYSEPGPRPRTLEPLRNFRLVSG